RERKKEEGRRKKTYILSFLAIYIFPFSRYIARDRNCLFCGLESAHSSNFIPQ
ncbi:MAG: hypothetical protein HC849_00750, partial [Oscillatoriales cyanobacterium RU_3_3]|nr:hypothetical protein [Oscillatoriales cyanobacterium RU_3_3]